MNPSARRRMNDPAARRFLEAAMLDEDEHFRDSEWQADAFGAALLMPAEALKEMAAQGALTIDQVMRQFRVSNPAASNRIHTLRRYRAVP